MISDEMAQMGFTVYHLKGAYALLVGSGVSRSARIKTGYEIIDDLISKHIAARELDTPSDLQRWFQEQYKSEPSYSAVLERFASSEVLRDKALKEYFEPTEEDRQASRKLPQRAHRAIASLVRDRYIRVILTTNFDRLLEHALEEIGIQATIVDDETSAKGLSPLQHIDVLIVKLHGDYIKGNLKNTKTELSSYSPKMHELLKRIVDEYGLIICGWSADWDIALRETIAARENRRYTIYFGNYGTNLTATAAGLVAQQQGVAVSHTGADDFFSDLEKVVSLYAGKRPRPFNREIAAQEVKRLLGIPDGSIELEELWRRELEKAYLALGQNSTYEGLPALNNFEDLEPYFERMAEVMDVVLEMATTLSWYGKGQHGKLLEITVSRLAELPRIFHVEWLRLIPSFLLIWLVGLVCALRDEWVYVQDVLVNPSVPRWNHRRRYSLSFPAFLYDSDGVEILRSDATRTIWRIRLPILTGRLSALHVPNDDVRRGLDVFELVLALIIMIESDEISNERTDATALLQQFYSRESWSSIARFLRGLHQEREEYGSASLFNISTFRRHEFTELGEYVARLTEFGKKQYQPGRNRNKYPNMVEAFLNGTAIDVDEDQR